MQIEEQVRALCKGIENIKTCLLVGGNPLPQQLYRYKVAECFVYYFSPNIVTLYASIVQN